MIEFSKEQQQWIDSHYVLLPKDANGEPIHVGDVMQGEKVGGGWCEPFKVVRMDIDRDGWEVYELGGYCHQPSLCRHKPPTVEDVLEDALNKAANLDRKEGYWPSAADITNIVNEIAPKLQLRDEQ